MPRAIWRHFLLLSVVLALPQACGLTDQFHRGAPELGWALAMLVGTVKSLQFNSNAAWALATAAGIAAGTAARGRSGLRSAIAIAVISTLAIIALDTLIGPRAGRFVRAAASRAATSAETAWPPYFRDTVVYSRADTLGDIRTGIQLLIQRPPELHDKLGSSWSQDHPRALAADSARFAPLLLLPFIAVGIGIATAEWVRQRVAFRTPRDELVARWLLAFVIVSGVTGFLSRWVDAIGFFTLHQSAYMRPMTMFWPALVVAILGWRFAARNMPTAAEPAGQ